MRAIARLAVVAALAGAATLTSGPAQAIPYPGQNQSVIFTYYASPAKTTIVGGWTYGTCFEPYDWVTHTAYSTYRTVTCTG